MIENGLKAVMMGNGLGVFVFKISKPIFIFGLDLSTSNLPQARIGPKDLARVLFLKRAIIIK